MKTLNMRQLLEAGVHFGHQARYWNPKMGSYIFGVRHKIHIINLEQTLPMLQDALQFIAKTAAKRGKILFVGTKHAAREVIKEEAARCGMPYVDYRWLGGMLTNYKTVRQSIRRLRKLETLIEDTDQLALMTKKEVLNLMREKDKLSACLNGIKNMGGLPDALFVIDVGHEKIAINEANRLRIPVAGVVDSNGDPDNIDYIIPGNDDALRSIRLYCKSVADVIIEARADIELEAAREAAEKKLDKKAKQAAPAVKKVVTRKAKEQPEQVEKAEAKPAATKAKAKAATPAKATKAKTKAKAKPATAAKAKSAKSADTDNTTSEQKS